MTAAVFAPVVDTVDDALLQQVLDHLTAAPSRYAPNFYGVRRLGSPAAHDVVGWALVLGGRPNVLRWSVDPGFPECEYVSGHLAYGHGSGEHLEREASELLGIPRATARPALFAEDLTLDDLWSAAGMLTAGRVARTATA